MEEAPKVEEKKSPFRRIVRRSSEPKKQPKEEPAEQTIEQITEQPPAEEGKDKTE